MKSKPNKWGVKLFVLADLSHGYSYISQFTGTSQHFQQELDLMDKNNFVDIASICSVIIVART